MNSIKNSYQYPYVLKEFNYSFADVYIFNGFVISEIKPGIIFTWENHAKVIIDDIVNYLGTDGSDLIYISNRIHSYSIMATDWIKFFKSYYSIKGYYVVGHDKSSMINTMFENLFFKSIIKKFTSLDAAIAVAEETQMELVSM